jgi:hypothetical protein
MVADLSRFSRPVTAVAAASRTDHQVAVRCQAEEVKFQLPAKFGLLAKFQLPAKFAWLAKFQGQLNWLQVQKQAEVQRQEEEQSQPPAE